MDSRSWSQPLTRSTPGTGGPRAPGHPFPVDCTSRQRMTDVYGTKKFSVTFRLFNALLPTGD